MPDDEKKTEDKPEEKKADKADKAAESDAPAAEAPKADDAPAAEAPKADDAPAADAPKADDAPAADAAEAPEGAEAPAAAAAPAEAEVEEEKPATINAEEGKYYWGTGRRKTSIARVRVRLGDGQFIVNKRPLDEFFRIDRRKQLARGPLSATKLTGKLDVFANVSGGGPTGQAGAVMMGLARAILAADDSFELTLRDDGYLTRDPRMVERKKYGLHGARRGRQTSKR